MSNALAIAGVSAVLRDLLNNGLIDHQVSSSVGGPVTVSVLSPDRVKLDGQEKAQLNLFLYQVTPNAGWSNVALPSRDDRGARVTNPPLALDLHYLLTAYGEKDFESEVLLGYGMQLLHETPVLARDAIRTALGTGTGGMPVSGTLGDGTIIPPGQLSASDLADQIEQIKISLQTLNAEEMSKLWSALGAHYRPTAAYHVSVVLIESSKSTKTALPVRSRNVYVLPFEQPFIEKVASAAPSDADPRITINSTVVVTGRKLKGETTLVRVGDAEVPATALTITDSQISFPLTSITSLRAGAQTAQVVQQLSLGTPPVAHRGFESNAVAFMLQPTITAAVDSSSQVTLTFVPRVGRTQRVTLLLNEFDAPNNRPARAYSFPAPANNGITNQDPDTDKISFAVNSVTPGAYLVRAQVDGAQSLLDDTAGKYDSPKITIS
ncbi:MAG TPA: DUF4255 domain-containing protein [Chthoniobacterales bacterium]|nr:DUF4255 domain-containing protein [Chthoniobacterales bacterium]